MEAPGKTSDAPFQPPAPKENEETKLDKKVYVVVHVVLGSTSATPTNPDRIPLCRIRPRDFDNGNPDFWFS